MPARPPADGPYLRHLRHLVLRGNAFTAVPPALAGAAALQTLDLGENEALTLRPCDVDGVLASLPELRALVLARAHPGAFGFGPFASAASGAAWDAQSVAALMQLARRLPQLEVQLERCAPPGLPQPCCCDGEGGGAADAEAAGPAARW